MRTLVLIAALLAAPASFAQDGGAPDAGSMDAGSMLVMAPVAVVGDPVSAPDAGVAEPAPLSTQEAASLMKTIFTSVKEGNWWMAASALLLLVVGLLRSVIKKFHAWLPDDNILDKPLIFLYDTKIGGWLMNWLTAVAGGIGTAIAAGIHPDFTIWKSVLMVSTTGTMLFELYQDVKEWWVARQAKKEVPAPAPAPAPEPPKA